MRGRASEGGRWEEREREAGGGRAELYLSVGAGLNTKL